MAATDTTVRVKPADEVVKALRDWVDTYLPRHKYKFEHLEDPEAIQATQRLARWANVTPHNEDLHEVFVARTASDEKVAEVTEMIEEAHKAFGVFVQIVAIRFFPEATEITDEVRAKAHGFMVRV